MQTIHHQQEANKFREGGVFYPTGYIVTAFPDEKTAARARSTLEAVGFDDEQLLSIDADTMAREAEQNLKSSGFMSVGASVPTREKQLELAQEGCHFILIQAPEDADQERAMQAIKDLPVRYAVKYRRLVIENLVWDVDTPDHKGEPARVP